MLRRCFKKAIWKIANSSQDMQLKPQTNFKDATEKEFCVPLRKKFEKTQI